MAYMYSSKSRYMVCDEYEEVIQMQNVDEW